MSRIVNSDGTECEEVYVNAEGKVISGSEKGYAKKSMLKQCRKEVQLFYDQVMKGKEKTSSSTISHFGGKSF